MNDHELDQLLRAAAPASAARVPAVAPRIRAGERELLQEIMTAPEEPDVVDESIEVAPFPGRRSAPKYSRWLVGAAAAVAVVVAVALPIQMFGGAPENVSPADRTDGPRPIVETGLPKEPLAGKGAPYFLMGQDDWDLQVADSSKESARVLLARPNFSRTLTISWHKPAGDWRQLKDGRRTGPRSADVQRVEVFGGEGELVSEGETQTLTFERNGVMVEFSGQKFPDLDEFADVVAGMQQVSGQEWWDSLPDSVVTPDEAVSVLNGWILRGPLPEGTQLGKTLTGWAMDDWRLGNRSPCSPAAPGCRSTTRPSGTRTKKGWPRPRPRSGP